MIYWWATRILLIVFVPFVPTNFQMIRPDPAKPHWVLTFKFTNICTIAYNKWVTWRQRAAGSRQGHSE